MINGDSHIAAVQTPMRILAVSALWQGANDYAFIRAFRRAGHSVRVVSDRQLFPVWQSKPLRILRRLLRKRLVREYNDILIAEAKQLKPDIFFVFKGPFVTATTLQKIRDMGAICIQFYPDTGFSAHSNYILEALQQYDWIFSTKPSHPSLLAKSHGLKNVSFLPHAFDPEVHAPQTLQRRDIRQYGCDVSFIGNISPKKYEILSSFMGSRLDFRIWGASAWDDPLCKTAPYYQRFPVWGLEYAKAISASRINLGLLYEGNKGGAKSDVITARTFEIPASGGFMLHERTDEVLQYFDEDKECAFFSGRDELHSKVEYYLAHETERIRIARAGRQRCLNAGYSVDERAKAIITKFDELR
jgi:hypothetical protein